MRISDWSSDVCSSDLQAGAPFQHLAFGGHRRQRRLGLLDLQGQARIGIDAAVALDGVVAEIADRRETDEGNDGREGMPADFAVCAHGGNRIIYESRRSEEGGVGKGVVSTVMFWVSTCN